MLGIIYVCHHKNACLYISKRNLSWKGLSILPYPALVHGWNGHHFLGFCNPNHQNGQRQGRTAHYTTPYKIFPWLGLQSIKKLGSCSSLYTKSGSVLGDWGMEWHFWYSFSISCLQIRRLRSDFCYSQNSFLQSQSFVFTKLKANVVFVSPNVLTA